MEKYRANDNHRSHEHHEHHVLPSRSHRPGHLLFSGGRSNTKPPQRPSPVKQIPNKQKKIDTVAGGGENILALRKSVSVKLMKLTISTVGALIFGALNFSAHATNTALYSQTFQFPFTYSGVTTSASTQYVYFPNSGNYEAMVLPFDIGLGTLDSVDVDWYWGASFSGITSLEFGGGASISMGGNISLANVQYNGRGTGNGTGGPPNTPFSVAVSPVTLHNNFAAAGAGVSYDPAIWAAFNGNSSYPAKLALTSSFLSYNGLASGTFTSNADLVVNYNYTIPEPSACALLGLGALSLAVRRRRAA